MKRSLKREKQPKGLDKTVINNAEDARIIDQKAEDQLRGWMQKSHFLEQTPALTERIVWALQQASIQQEIKRRRRQAFWWALLSLCCGCCSLILVFSFMQKDIGASLTTRIVQYQSTTFIGLLDLPYSVLAFLAFISLGLLMELLLSSIKVKACFKRRIHQIE